ncbi:MAG: fructose 1,6-bisphosphatase [Hyphomicrobiaceae bacterium]
MKITLSVITADIGSIGGHVAPSARLLETVRGHVAGHGKGPLITHPTCLTALALVGLVALTMLAGCSSTALLPQKTLDGHKALVIAHRGASGYLPENTLEAYQRAIDLGADAIELDLISTKDGVLIASHYPNLAITTDVASRPEFARRKRENWPIDGELQSGWFAHDFTLAEIKTLGVVATDPERPQQYNGKFRIVTLQEVIDLVKSASKRLGRTIAIYPETKNPTYHRDLGLPLEDKLISAIQSAGWNRKTAPVYVQSFEPSSLKEMRAKGLKVRMVQLIDGDGYDLKTGGITYAPPFDRPYDWEKSGDQRRFRDMVTPAGLAEIKTYADGIGPWKPYIVPVKGQLDDAGNLKDVNGDGKIDLRDAITQNPTSLIDDAHKLGLFVHAFTFRNESRYLAHSYLGDPQAEYSQFFRLGVDGVFSEFPDTAISAR